MHISGNIPLFALFIFFFPGLFLIYSAQLYTSLNGGEEFHPNQHVSLVRIPRPYGLQGFTLHSTAADVHTVHTVCIQDGTLEKSNISSGCLIQWAPVYDTVIHSLCPHSALGRELEKRGTHGLRLRHN